MTKKEQNEMVACLPEGIAKSTSLTETQKKVLAAIYSKRHTEQYTANGFWFVNNEELAKEAGLDPKSGTLRYTLSRLIDLNLINRKPGLHGRRGVSSEYSINEEGIKQMIEQSEKSTKMKAKRQQPTGGKNTIELEEKIEKLAQRIEQFFDEIKEQNDKSAALLTALLNRLGDSELEKGSKRAVKRAVSYATLPSDTDAETETESETDVETELHESRSRDTDEETNSIDNVLENGDRVVEIGCPTSMSSMSSSRIEDVTPDGNEDSHETTGSQAEHATQECGSTNKPSVPTAKPCRNVGTAADKQPSVFDLFNKATHNANAGNISNAEAEYDAGCQLYDAFKQDVTRDAKQRGFTSPSPRQKGTLAKMEDAKGKAKSAISKAKRTLRLSEPEVGNRPNFDEIYAYADEKIGKDWESQFGQKTEDTPHQEEEPAFDEVDEIDKQLAKLEEECRFDEYTVLLEKKKAIIAARKAKQIKR